MDGKALNSKDWLRRGSTVVAGLKLCQTLCSPWSSLMVVFCCHFYWFHVCSASILCMSFNGLSANFMLIMFFKSEQFFVLILESSLPGRSFVLHFRYTREQGLNGAGRNADNHKKPSKFSMHEAKHDKETPHYLSIISKFIKILSRQVYPFQD